MRIDELSQRLRADLEGRYQGLEVPGPVWPQIESGLREVRRRRQVRRVRAGAAALALVVVVAGLSTLLPRLRTDQLAAEGGPGRSALGRQAPKGSLARDLEYLTGLREAASRAAGEQDWSGHRAIPAGQLRVIFAGDVGFARLAVLEFPYQSGARFVDFVGRPGQVPDALIWGDRSVSAASDPWTRVITQPGRPEAALVRLATGPVDSAAVTGPMIAEDGTVSWTDRTPAPSGPGWWQLVLPVQFDDPFPWISEPDGHGWQPLVPVLDSATDHREERPGVHGGPALSPSRLTVLNLAQQLSGLRFAVSSRRLLWSAQTDSGYDDVVVVTATSGAHVLVGLVEDRDPGSTGFGSAAARVVPAGPLERLCFAWADGQAPTSAERVVVVGPVGSERASVKGPGGRSVPVALTNGGGSIRLNGAVRVDFTDAAGRPTGGCPVSRGWEQLRPPAR